MRKKTNKQTNTAYKENIKIALAFTLSERLFDNVCMRQILVVIIVRGVEDLFTDYKKRSHCDRRKKAMLELLKHKLLNTELYGYLRIRIE